MSLGTRDPTAGLFCLVVSGVALGLAGATMWFAVRFANSAHDIVADTSRDLRNVAAKLSEEILALKSRMGHVEGRLAAEDYAER
jgi:hypothetical protein